MKLLPSKFAQAKLSAMIIASLVVVACGGSGSSGSSASAQSTNEQANTQNEVQLQAPSDQDTSISQVDTSLAAVELPSINTQEEAVSFSQVLEGSQIESNSASSYSKTSRSFSLSVDSDKLAKGFSIPTSSKDPVIRIVPSKLAKKINANDIEIQRSGTWISAKDSFKTVASQAELKAAGMDVSADTLALQLKASPENVNLRLKASAAQGGTYKILVLEPSSDKVLTLDLERNRILQGDKLQLNAKLAGNNKKFNMDKVDAFILSPSGEQKIPVDINIDDNGEVNTKLDTNALKSTQAGLWEVHISAKHGEGDSAILRDAKVAFALSPKTARLKEQVSVEKAQGDSGDLHLSFNVETAVAGRYEVSAIIYGQNEQGEVVPGVLTAKAQWLNESGSITLDVPQDQLLEAGIEKPYEVRHLALKDQTRMAELWLQEKAFTIQ